MISGGGELAGGPGDDRLSGGDLDGGDGADVLTGNAGRNLLDGGAGADLIIGGAGVDLIEGDGREGEGIPPAPDVIDGGVGFDQVDFSGHSAGVHVDLTAQAGAEDRLTRVESVIGTIFDDVIAGDGHNNWFSGSGGRDVLTGRAGNDDLVGSGMLDGGRGDDELIGGRGHGPDVFDGGHGDDLLNGDGPVRYAGGPGHDRIVMGGAGATVGCGPGHDDVVHQNRVLLPRDCEAVEDRLPIHPRRGGRGTLVFTVPRARHLRRGTVELRVVGRSAPFAVGRFAGGERTAIVSLAVPRRIRRLRREPLPVEVRVHARDLDHPRGVLRVRWVIDLPR